jgi:hypothetical protein
LQGVLLLQQLVPLVAPYLYMQPACLLRCCCDALLPGLPLRCGRRHPRLLPRLHVWLRVCALLLVLMVRLLLRALRASTALRVWLCVLKRCTGRAWLQQGR